MQPDLTRDEACLAHHLSAAIRHRLLDVRQAEFTRQLNLDVLTLPESVIDEAAVAALRRLQAK